MDSDTYYLRIKDATVEDAGQYTVEAVNDGGTVSAKVTATVGAMPEPAAPEAPKEEPAAPETPKEEPAAPEAPKEEPEPQPEPVPEKPKAPMAPAFVIEPQSITVNEGETVKLTCQLSGIPLKIFSLVHSRYILLLTFL